VEMEYSAAAANAVYPGIYSKTELKRHVVGPGSQPRTGEGNASHQSIFRLSGRSQVWFISSDSVLLVNICGKRPKEIRKKCYIQYKFHWFASSKTSLPIFIDCFFSELFISMSTNLRTRFMKADAALIASKYNAES
jgi:hypothetical protein